MKYITLFNNHSNYNTYITGNDKVLPNVSYCENENEVHLNPWTDPKLVCKYNITDISSPTALRTENEPNMFKSMEIDGVLLDSLVTSYQFNTTGEHTVKYELYDETKVGNNAPLFNGITTLTSASIPNSVTTIGNAAFHSCTGHISITIPNSVTSISQAIFNNCIGLTTIKVDSGNTVYDSRNNCNAIIETATNTLIAGCKNTVIPNSVTTIGDYAFNLCTGLTSIIIPNFVTTIRQYAFGGCSGLTSITIPNSVTTIGNYTFSGCSGITSITSMATTAPTIQSSTFYNVKTGGTLNVPTGSTGYDVWMGTGNYYLGKYSWTKVEQ